MSTTHVNEQAPDLDGLEDPDAITSDPTLPLTEEIQREIMSAILKDLGVLQFASKLLTPNCFVIRTHKFLADIAFGYYGTHKQLPTKSILDQELRQRIKNERVPTVHLAELECVYEYIDPDFCSYSWYKSKITDFALQCSVRRALAKFLDDSQRGNSDVGGLIESLSLAQRSVGLSDNKTFALGERSATIRPEWLVQSILRRNTIGTMFGESGCRKTWLAIDLALSIATGTDFLGKFKVKQGKVFYVISEGASDFEDRATAWSKTRKVNLPSIDQLAYYPGAYDFNDDNAVQSCLGHIEERLGGADLIVLDTLAKNFNGDADKNADMGRFLNQMERLREETNAAVLVLHHTGWGNTDRERGGRAIRDNVDTSILVEKDGEFSKLICKKQKLGQEFPAMLSRFEVVRLHERDTDDEQVTALVGHFIESQEGRTANQLVDLLGGLFQIQDCYTQQELVTALKARWKGKAPGRDRLRELIAEQVGQTISHLSESGKYVYRLMA
jgi:putative DNA primase/helicase